MNRELLEYVRGLERRIGALERQERPAPVVAVYTTSAGQNIPNNSATVVDFGTQVVDTHNAVTTGAFWHFTAPLAGQYAVLVLVRFANTTNWAEHEQVFLRAFVDGTGGIVLGYRTGLDSSGTTAAMGVAGRGVVPLGAGGALDVRLFQGSGDALALQNDGNFNHISIFRIH